MHGLRIAYSLSIPDFIKILCRDDETNLKNFFFKESEEKKN